MPQRADPSMVRELIQQTELTLSDEQIQQLSAGESVRLDSDVQAAELGECPGIKFICRTIAGRECCLYVDIQNGLKVCVSIR